MCCCKPPTASLLSPSSFIAELPVFIAQLELLLWTAPALLLSLIASWMVRSAYSSMSRVPAQMSGFAAARHMLDRNGLRDVQIEIVPGKLSDHYSPREKILRLSPDVYHGRSMAAVGIAAHEVGHAIQDARRYAPLVVRNAAVSMAGFGSNAGMLIAFLGLMTSQSWLLLIGIALFSAMVFFQLVNLPVEFDASQRAKRQLVDLGMISEGELPYVRRVLTAAALTYVAATLQSILTLLYLISRYNRSR